MMVTLLLRLLITMAALKGADVLLNDFQVAGGWQSLVLLAVVFGLLNWILKPILVFFSIPLLILTIGLFYFVINALILYFASELLPTVVRASPFGVLAGSIVIAVLHWLLSIVLRVRRQR